MKDEEWLSLRVGLYSSDAIALSRAEELSMSRDAELDTLLTCENAAETEKVGAMFAGETDQLAATLEQPQEVFRLPEEPAVDHNRVEAAVGEAAAPVISQETAQSQTASRAGKLVSLPSFAPNRFGLHPNLIAEIARIALEIASFEGTPRAVRKIQLVARDTGHSRISTLLARKRVATVRAALQQAIERAWPNLTKEIAVVEEVASAGELQSGRKRAVEVILETDPAQRSRNYPAIFEATPGEYQWRNSDAQSPKASQDSSETERGKALRARSSEGFFYVMSADMVPSRWICALEIRFEPESADHAPGTGPITLHATGLLISPRHVLTAGHCLYCRRHPSSKQEESGENGTPFPDVLAATSATISPGRNALAQLFGNVSIDDPRRLRSSALWRVSRATNTEFDFGLITLPAGLPRAVGYWGGPDHMIAPVRSEALRDAMVQTAGYPILGRNGAEAQASLPLGVDGDSTQWTTLGVVTEISSNEVFHDMPVRCGQNGSPVWTKTGSQSTLIGILGLNQRMVRITPRLLRRLRTWMAQDGVRASF